MRKIKVVRPIYNRNLSDIKENGRKVMEFISIAHGNQKVRAKNSRNEEDSPQNACGNAEMRKKEGENV